MFVLRPTDNKQLMSRQLPEHDRGMRCHENLKRRRVFFRAERPKQADDPMRLQTMLGFIHEQDRAFSRSLALKPGDQQAGGTDAEAAKRNTTFVMQRDRSARERH